jgi:peptidoglycan/xylan/chitin deacetylase (PgdA/CDA1 family)
MPAAILCYHSLTSPELPSASTAHVPTSELMAAVDVVRAFGEIVPLRVLVERYRAGRATRGLFAITFDDAYEAVRRLGHPLRDAGIPITIFVTTTAADSGRPFWWDRVDDVFPRVAPARWRAFEDRLGLDPAYRTGQPLDSGPLRPLRQWILATFCGRWPAHLEEPLAELEAEHGSQTAHRPMTWDELSAFAADSLVDVGVHTATHPVLPLLEDAAAAAEIRDAYAAIRARIPRALPVLAIPFGLYTARTVDLARDAGMDVSLTLGNHPLRRAASDGALPRLSMGRGLRRWKLALRLVAPRRASPYPLLPSPTS